MAAFRHRFYKHLVDLYSTPFYDELEKESYYGGRLELFYQGKVEGNCYQLDVVSQYPSVMYSNLYPTKRIGSSDSSPVKLEVKDLSIAHIAKVRIKTDRSRFPLRLLREGTLYPVGEFITTLAGPELLAAKQAGCIEELYSWTKYELRPLFREFVAHFFEKRQEAKQRNDDQESYFLKIMMNSLYGKFGQQTPEWKDLDSRNDLPQWVQSWLSRDEYDQQILQHNPNAPQMFLHSKLDSRKVIRYRTIGKHAQITEERKPHRNSFCAIASYVTSYARMMLDRLIETAGRGEVYYVVTDSIFTSQTGFDRLCAETQVDSGRLGSLTTETSGTNGLFKALHHWRLGSKFKYGSRKSGGNPECPRCHVALDGLDQVCNSCGSTIEEFANRETQFEGIKGVLRRRNREGIIVRKHTKIYQRKYDRGTVTRSGWIAPHEFHVPNGKNKKR
jgi:hypothetical protein